VGHTGGQCSHGRKLFGAYKLFIQFLKLLNVARHFSAHFIKAICQKPDFIVALP